MLRQGLLLVTLLACLGAIAAPVTNAQAAAHADAASVASSAEDGAEDCGDCDENADCECGDCDSCQASPAPALVLKPAASERLSPSGIAHVPSTDAYLDPVGVPAIDPPIAAA